MHFTNDLWWIKLTLILSFLQPPAQFYRLSRFSLTPFIQPHRLSKAIPLQTLTGPEDSRRLRLPDFLRQPAHEGGKVVSPTHRPPLPQEIFLVLISVRGWVDPGPQCDRKDYVNGKIPVTPSGIEPATFLFVAQCLNQYATARPQNHHR
jgi:hypothetical protein